MSSSAPRNGRPALAPTTLDASSVEQFDQAYQQAFYEGDYQAMASVYTADAKLMVEDSELIQGYSHRTWWINPSPPLRTYFKQVFSSLGSPDRPSHREVRLHTSSSAGTFTDLLAT